MENLSPVRPSPIAGSWYPGDSVRLKVAISQYVDQAKPQPLPGEVIGLISPHAGYIYSGATAGYAYRSVQGKSYDIVVVASPLHDYRPEPFLTSGHEGYGTPLGTVPINQPLLVALQEDLAVNLGFEMTPIAYDREHSLEIQLPFLQYVLATPFELLPIMVREYRSEPLQAFAHSLAKVLEGKKALLVASTDLSHFYNEDTANHLDRYMLEQISEFSPEGVIRAEAEGKGFACGNGAVAMVLWAALELGGKSVTVLHHSTSANTTGDRSQVVGYGAAAICG